MFNVDSLSFVEFFYYSSYGNDNASIEISNLNCSSSSYLTIYQCSYSTFVDSGCINNDTYDATVYCCK